MKIIATSDTHFPFSIPPSDCEVFVHAGDLMLGGGLDEWYPSVHSLRHAAGSMKLFCPGNHDKFVELYERPVEEELREVGVQLIHGYYPNLLPNGMSLLALPFVVNLRGWAYNRDEEWIDDYLENFTDVDVVVSHGPPYKTLDALYPEESNARKRHHVGSKAMRRWFDRLEKKPLVWICGHIHESYGSKVIDGCRFFNVSMCDATYRQSNSPVVIEL